MWYKLLAQPWCGSGTRVRFRYAGAGMRLRDGPATPASPTYKNSLGMDIRFPVVGRRVPGVGEEGGARPGDFHGVRVERNRKPWTSISSGAGGAES